MMRRSEVETELQRLERLVPVLSQDKRIPSEYWRRQFTCLRNAGASSADDVYRLRKLWRQVIGGADSGWLSTVDASASPLPLRGY
jgi:hypothetical protein